MIVKGDVEGWGDVEEATWDLVMLPSCRTVRTWRLHSHSNIYLKINLSLIKLSLGQTAFKSPIISRSELWYLYLFAEQHLCFIFGLSI